MSKRTRWGWAILAVYKCQIMKISLGARSMHGCGTFGVGNLNYKGYIVICKHVSEGCSKKVAHFLA